jgi:hypothetical protein
MQWILALLGLMMDVTVAPPDAVAPLDPVAMRDSVAVQVEALRGRRFRTPVPLHAVADSIMTRQLRAQMARFYPPDALRDEETACRQLGLWPAERDLQASIEAVLDEQVAGYYDTDLDAFFVARRFAPEFLPIIMAHELTHALDDQLFGIDSLVQACAGDNDRITALAGVVEGSGMVVMSMYLMTALLQGDLTEAALAQFQESEMARSVRLLEAPPLLQRDLLAPYILGMIFMLQGEPERLLSGVKGAVFDSVFTALPRSSEQLLHPWKYWDPKQRDEPTGLADPDLSRHFGAGWRKRATGVMGELRLAQLAGASTPVLDAGIQDPEAWTNAAATGWDGDRWQLYTDGRTQVTVLATWWDSDADAREFAAAIATGAVPVARAAPSPASDSTTVSAPHPIEPRADWLVERHQRLVVIVAGATGKVAGAVARASRAAW